MSATLSPPSSASIGMIEAPVKLSQNQQRVIDTALRMIHARQGGFLFVEGRAGVGKSVTLRKLRESCRAVVCAPTGLAALNVGGATVHRTFGLKVGRIDPNKQKAARYPEALRSCDVIVIDEISMVRADMIGGINACLQKTLHNSLPFGGKPVVAFGDMCQLEPVVQQDDKDWMESTFQSHFWFDGHVFNPGPQNLLSMPSMEIQRIELSEVFRQQGNPEFIDALNAVRIGDPSGLEFLNRRAHVNPAGTPVILTFTNKKAEAMNASRLAHIDEEEKTFVAEVTGDFPDSDFPCPTPLSLKVGAQVMITRNMIIDDCERVVNGDVGEVIGFIMRGPVVKLRDGRVLCVPKAMWEKKGYAKDAETGETEEVIEGTFTQIPLKLAWSLTVHKLQGATLESAIIEAEGKAFAHGQLYVACSRVKSFEGLYLRRRLGFEDLKVNERIREWCGLPEFKAAPIPTLDAGAFL